MTQDRESRALVHAAAFGPPEESLPERVERLECYGVDGLYATDHLFFSRGRGRDQAASEGDPFVRLAAAGQLSDRLILVTGVVNIGLLHPALALRSFHQLATCFGAHRVIAGIGAGWNREEFEALGIPFPPLDERLELLAEACEIARSQFRTGVARVRGSHVSAIDLPLLPVHQPAVRLLLGGGSDRFLELAGTYADVVDLNGSSRQTHLRGPLPSQLDPLRRLSTTTDDLARSVARVREVARSAGRDADAIEFSIMANAVRFCGEDEIESVEREVCASVGLEHRSLAECPYVYIGPPDHLRRLVQERTRRLRLGHIMLYPTDDASIEGFCALVGQRD